jgi:hypothetical protein
MHNIVCWWVGSILGIRKITATLAREALEGSVAMGYLHGVSLSPLFWSLVVDILIRGLGENGYYSLGYADDIAILINRKFPTTVSELHGESCTTVL